MFEEKENQNLQLGAISFDVMDEEKNVATIY